jgi:hypothetical protein
MNCELMLTYDTPTLRQTGSRNLTGQKMLPTIYGTYMKLVTSKTKTYYIHYTLAPRRGRGVYCFTSVLPSVQDIFRRIFLSNYLWQKSDVWSQASFMYTILWVAFLDPSDFYFLFADLVGFSTHWTYMLIFRRIFLSNYWWQKSDISSRKIWRNMCIYVQCV